MDRSSRKPSRVSLVVLEGGGLWLAGLDKTCSRIWWSPVGLPAFRLSATFSSVPLPCKLDGVPPLLSVRSSPSAGGGWIC